MSHTFRQVDRETLFLLPPSLDDWLPEGHLARFIVEIVAQLDLTLIKAAYAGRGSKAHHPEMLLALLFYGYATGVFSSRKLERATYDSVAFRYIAANDHPDHDTIATFRKRFLPELTPLFVQILLIANQMNVLKLGKVSLDGTKIKANASKHRALSWKHACKLEKQIKAEVENLLRQAEEADRADLPDGLDIPEELERREQRLAAIAEAKTEIERRAAERYTEERADFEKKLATRKDKEQKTGKKSRGKKPKPPEPGPRDKDQVNLTDEESRIMPTSGGGFEQCYLAQLYLKASLHAVDSYFNQVRTRLSPLQRAVHSPSSARRTWYGKQPYDPRMVQKLLDLLRLFHNYCLKSKKDKMTPAMRLGLARAPIDLDEVIYFQR